MKSAEFLDLWTKHEFIDIMLSGSSETFSPSPYFKRESFDCTVYKALTHRGFGNSSWPFPRAGPGPDSPPS